MNLECPGCHSRLRLDPAKLPPGATTAVCPKCRTKIPIAGAAPATGDVSVQCGTCGARLKVNMNRLKPGVTQSRCPKCGGSVSLPAAPPAQPASPPEVNAPTALPVSAQTRRLDAREMGLILGARPAGSSEPASSAAPIALDPPLEQNDVDLGRLIDRSVEGLGSTPDQGSLAATSPDARSARPERENVQGKEPSGSTPQPGTPPPIPAEGPVHGPELSMSGLRERAARSAESGPRLRPESGQRPVPRFDRALGAGLPTAAPRRSGSMRLLAAGVLSGSIVGGVVALAAGMLPAEFLPPVPAILQSLGGARLGGLILTVVLAALGAFLGGMASPPAPSTDEETAPPAKGASAFRCTVASALLGLIAGIGITISGGGLDVIGTLSWTIALLAAGLLTALFANTITARR